MFAVSVFGTLLFILLAPVTAFAAPDFNEFFQKHSAVMLLIDPNNGQIVSANTSAANFYGYSQNELETKTVQDLNTFSKEEVAKERQLALSQNRNFFIFRHRLASGELRTVEVFSVPFTFQDKALLHSIITDVTPFRTSEDSVFHYQGRLEKTIDDQASELNAKDQRMILILSVSILVLVITIIFLIKGRHAQALVEKRLLYERKRFEEIIRGTNVGTWEWEIQLDQIICNDRWANIIGYQPAECASLHLKDWMKLIHPDDEQQIRQALKTVLDKQHEYFSAEYRMRSKTGCWVWVQSKGKVVIWSEDGSPEKMSGTQQDITQRKNAEQAMHRKAQHDSLTSLPTRSLLFDHCNFSIAYAKRHKTSFAILFIDLDKFKPINDAFGHEAGDEVLKEIATRLTTCVRETDTVCRYGGDEFIILLNSIISYDDAALIAEKVSRKVNQSFQLSSGKTVYLSCSIGLARYPDDGASIEALIHTADDRMYKVKKNKSAAFAVAEL